MKYVIYSLFCPSILQEHETRNYSHYVIDRVVLEKLDVHGIESEHDSMESAFSEIKTHSEKLKFHKLTIMPFISINWEGKIN